jgi:HD superfamily phosphohydrolase
MIKTLYNHHATLIAEKMLQRSLEDYVERKSSVDEMMQEDDYTMHSKLLDAEGEAEELYTRIRDRDLYKRALVWTSEDVPREGLKSLEDRIENPGQVEKKIAEEAGVQESRVIIDTPETPEIQEIDVRIKKNGDLRNLKDESPIPDALTEAEWRTVAMKVYCPRENVQEVQEAAKKVLKDYTRVLENYF